MRRALCLLLFVSTPLLAQAGDLEQPLPVDPSITMGSLPNGMHYWIRPNKTPPGKVSLLLHFSSGSLNENDNQRGLAHFLEHMAFNGSENFPAGEMVTFFESLGMKFGQHQNAFTSFDQTTYMMHLPDTKKETLEKVFTYFADVGWRLTLADAELNKERGVILEEKRARKGAGQRVMEKALPIVAPDSRLSVRIPIGLESVIKEAPRERFVEYYTKWYRPEHATLIVCGDVDPAAITPLIDKAFSAWKRSEKPAEFAEPGIKVHTKLDAAVITDPELTQAQIGLGSLSALRPRETVGDFRRGMTVQIGSWIVNRRLRQLAQKGEASYQTASVRSRDFFGACTSSDIDAGGDPAKWKEMLTAVIAQTNLARVHGFTDAELELAKKTILSGAEQSARGEATVPSTA
ncbi:MAG: M16 family metallopeptidase, partial [Planctomycetota bacterium]